MSTGLDEDNEMVGIGVDDSTEGIDRIGGELLVATSKLVKIFEGVERGGPDFEEEAVEG